jgi:hypothetical protein
MHIEFLWGKIIGNWQIGRVKRDAGITLRLKLCGWEVDTTESEFHLMGNFSISAELLNCNTRIRLGINL